MNRLAVLLFMLGYVVAMPARAAPANDRVHLVQGSVIHAEKAGEVRLAYLYIPDPSVLTALTGTSVKLQPQGEDRYGRTLAILTREGADEPVQVELLRAGKALVYTPGAFRQSAAWMKAEAEAQAAKRGLWAQPPLTSTTVAEHQQQFVRVQGTITRIYQARDAWYLNFGEDWKTDFSLKIPRRNWRAFGKDWKPVEGITVLARGSVIQENGPMIVITRPEQLEVLHAHP